MAVGDQIFFTLGWQSNMWIYSSKPYAVVYSLTVDSVEITNTGYKSYIVFPAIKFVTVSAIFFCCPETSRISLEAVHLLFADRDGKRASLLFRLLVIKKNKQFMEIQTRYRNGAGL
ncbi:hypothetical protein B0O99DRAFT_595415 [Bisporella sp. PMI_857]|nr:hypothetical protein B0O99DRAFT_595415 [Bisporella sp. PMI_857]